MIPRAIHDGGDWTIPEFKRECAAQFALFEERKRTGAKRIGWKVGFGAPAAKEKLGIAMPLIGFLLDRAVLAE